MASQFLLSFKLIAKDLSNKLPNHKKYIPNFLACVRSSLLRLYLFGPISTISNSYCYELSTISVRFSSILERLPAAETCNIIAPDSHNPLRGKNHFGEHHVEKTSLCGLPRSSLRYKFWLWRQCVFKSLCCSQSGT